MKYVETNKIPINTVEFDKSCGVGECCVRDSSRSYVLTDPLTGFSITPDELLARTEKYISSADVTGWANLGSILNALRGSPELRWANPLEVKDAVEKVFLEKFGPKVAAKPKAKVDKLSLLA